MNLIFCALWVYSNSTVGMNVFMLRAFWIRSARIRVKSRKKVPAARCNWTTNYNGPRLAVGCRGCTRQRVLPRPLRPEAIATDHRCSASMLSFSAVIATKPGERQEDPNVDHPPHPHQDRSVRDRKGHADLEDGMRFAHDPAKGLRVGKALALPGRSRIHLLFGMGFGRRDRGLSQHRRPQGDRAAHARTERGEGGGQALRARAIAARRGRSRLGSAPAN